MSGRTRITATIKVRSPFLFPAVDVAAAGLDASPLRMPDGTPVLPGDHIRGHLRHVAEAENEAVARKLFGWKSDENSNEPERGALIISDFIATGFSTTDNRTGNDFKSERALSYRVAIDDETSAAKDGMLKVIELVAAPETTVTFKGTIILRHGNQKTDIDTASIEQLLRSIDAVGAQKTSGFGEIESVECTAVELDHTPAANAGDTVTLDLSISGPFIVDAGRDAFNFYRGSTVIPGSALKGMIAEHLMDAGVIGKQDANLSKIHISHAWPLVSGKLGDRAVHEHRAVSPKDDRFVTRAEVDAAFAAGGTPAFPTDWKDWAGRRAALGRPGSDLLRQARVRTAIAKKGNEKEGTADDGMLFVETAIVPQDAKWRVTLSRNGADQGTFDHVVGALLQGTHGLGKTGAHVTAERVQSPPAQPPTVQAGRIAVMLETPAILTEIETVVSLDHDKPAMRKTLKDKYAAYFSMLLPNSRLMSVHGGDQIIGRYYGYRFGTKNKYTPFCMTRAGTVFELDVGPGDVAALTACLQSGLPPVFEGALLQDPVSNWGKVPMVPTNGYGEISLVGALAASAKVAKP
ncbi:MAG: RAMP superfamily CRISPR-associated protein [Ahrensia sp.]